MYKRQAMGGAEHVCAVDVSEAAVEMARENAERNGLADRMEFRAANVFDLLPELEEKGKGIFDFIILDPPASVSYTHLDVYKRQVGKCVKSAALLAVPGIEINPALIKSSAHHA